MPYAHQTRAPHDASARRRVYQDWPGNDTFFCGGRLVAGPSWLSLLGTCALVLAPSAVFLALVVPDVARAYSWALLAFALWLPLFSVSILLLTGCSDPGIIPRIPAPEAHEFPNGRPRMREIEVNGRKVSLKWNDSTNFYQPPRAHHCSVNNDCIEKFDHHCPWVGTTIGQRNYRYFLLFVFNTTLLCFYVFALCALQVRVRYEGLQRQHAQGTRATPASVADALQDAPAAVALMCLTFMGVWFVGGLSGFHAYLVSHNQTTYENFRFSYGKGENPYDRGCLRNWVEVFFTPRLPRKVDFRAYVEDVEAGGPVVDRDGLPTLPHLQPVPGCCSPGETRPAHAPPPSSSPLPPPPPQRPHLQQQMAVREASQRTRRAVPPPPPPPPAHATWAVGDGSGI